MSGVAEITALMTDKPLNSLMLGRDIDLVETKMHLLANLPAIPTHLLFARSRHGLLNTHRHWQLNLYILPCFTQIVPQIPERALTRTHSIWDSWHSGGSVASWSCNLHSWITTWSKSAAPVSRPHDQTPRQSLSTSNCNPSLRCVYRRLAGGFYTWLLLWLYAQASIATVLVKQLQSK